MSTLHERAARGDYDGTDVQDASPARGWIGLVLFGMAIGAVLGASVATGLERNNTTVVMKKQDRLPQEASR